MPPPLSSLVFLVRFLRALWRRTGRKGRRVTHSRRRKTAIQLLTPVGNVATGTVDIHHVQRLIARVGQLVEHSRGKKNRLTSGDFLPLGSHANFASSLEDHVHFLLLLVMPGHLASLGFQDHVSHGEPFRRDWLSRLADHPSSPTTRGKGSSGDLADVCDNHTKRARHIEVWEARPKCAVQGKIALTDLPYKG